MIGMQALLGEHDDEEIPGAEDADVLRGNGSGSDMVPLLRSETDPTRKNNGSDQEMRHSISAPDFGRVPSDGESRTIQRARSNLILAFVSTLRQDLRACEED